MSFFNESNKDNLNNLGTDTILELFTPMMLNAQCIDFYNKNHWELPDTEWIFQHKGNNVYESTILLYAHLPQFLTYACKTKDNMVIAKHILTNPEFKFYHATRQPGFNIQLPLYQSLCEKETMEGEGFAPMYKINFDKFRYWLEMTYVILVKYNEYFKDVSADNNGFDYWKIMLTCPYYATSEQMYADLDSFNEFLKWCIKERSDITSEVYPTYAVIQIMCKWANISGTTLAELPARQMSLYKLAHLMLSHIKLQNLDIKRYKFDNIKQVATYGI